MLNGKKIIVVMPAYNAAKTLAKTGAELARETVDEIIVVDERRATPRLWREEPILL